MPDPITLATLAVAYIAGEITSGGLKEIGKEVYHAIKDSFQPDEITVLGLLEKYPANQDIQNELVGKIEGKLTDNPLLAGRLEELLKQVTDFQIKQNTISQIGDGNIAIQDVSGSDITINK